MKPAWITFCYVGAGKVCTLPVIKVSMATSLSAGYN